LSELAVKHLQNAAKKLSDPGQLKMCQDELAKLKMCQDELAKLQK